MKKILIALSLATILCSCDFKAKVHKDNVDDPPASDIVQRNSDNKPEDLPFPLNTGFSDDYLKATFWKCNYSSAGPLRTYWVILPNTLRPTQVEPEANSAVKLTGIGVYNTIDKTLPYIEVRLAYETLKNSVDPADWLRNKVKLTGETVLQENPFKYEDGQANLDVLTFKKIANGERVISRFVGQKKGNDYFLIKVSCNEKDYAAQANTIFHVVSHWGIKV